MITLGALGFNGPFLVPFWAPPKGAGLYAILVPGWRLLTFRALYFGDTEAFRADLLKSHPRYAQWTAITGTHWNLYIATHEMPLSSPAQREAAARELARTYRPEFRPVDTPAAPRPRQPLRAPVLRNAQDK